LGKVGKLIERFRNSEREVANVNRA
jgi:hypothetical protein